MVFLVKIDTNVQFEKVAESAPTAIFYDEGGEEVERVLLEGLSRCRDLFDVDDVDFVDDVDDVDDVDYEARR